MPHQAAGLRIDPPPSVPRAKGASPAATAAPAPPEEPPGVWPRLARVRVAAQHRVSGGGPRAAARGQSPLEEPPGVWPRLHGLRVAPNTRLSVTPTQPSVGVFVLPSMMAPAAFRRATEGASSVGTLSR